MLLESNQGFRTFSSGGKKARQVPSLPAKALLSTQLAARYRSSLPPRLDRQFLRWATASNSSEWGGRDGRVKAMVLIRWNQYLGGRSAQQHTSQIQTSGALEECSPQVTPT